jgi:hypothetical protein
MSDLENIERYADSLYGELEAEKHNHRKDNAYLLAENQRLRDALEAMDTYTKRLRIDQGRGLQVHIRAALAGTPSEDPPIEDLPDPSHDDVRGRAPSFNLFRKRSEDT